MMTTARNEFTPCVVLRDAAGAYYLIPVAVVEACRVPQEDTPEVLAALERQRGDDTDGYAGGTAGGYVPMGLATFMLGPLVGTAIGAAIGGYANGGDEADAAEAKKHWGTMDMQAGNVQAQRRRLP